MQFRPKNFQRPSYQTSSKEPSLKDGRDGHIKTEAVEPVGTTDTNHGRGGRRRSQAGGNSERSRFTRRSRNTVQQEIVAFGGNIGAGTRSRLTDGPPATDVGTGTKDRSLAGERTKGSVAASVRQISSEDSIKKEEYVEMSSSSDDSLDGEDDYSDARAPILLSAMNKDANDVHDDLADSVDDEASRLAGSMQELQEKLCSLRGGSSSETDIMLFQLPSKLPIPMPIDSGQSARYLREKTIEDAKSSSATVDSVHSQNDYFSDEPSTLRDVTPMKLGKLLFFRSGRIKMRIGDVLFDVTPGASIKTRQEVACVDMDSKQCAIMGKVSQRVVVTPDLDVALDGKAIPEWPFEPTVDFKDDDQDDRGVDIVARGTSKGKNVRALVIDDDDDDEGSNGEENDDDKDNVAMDRSQKPSQKEAESGEDKGKDDEMGNGDVKEDDGCKMDIDGENFAGDRSRSENVEKSRQVRKSVRQRKQKSKT